MIRSDFAYDKMGRVTLQQDFGGIERGPGGLSYSRAVTYNAKGQVASDNVMTRRDRNEVYTPGATVVSDEWRNITTYGYGSGSSYALGSVLTATVQAYRNGFDTGASGAPDTSTTTSYEWWDGAVQTYITHDSDTGSGSNPIYNTDLQLNGLGQLVAAEVDDGVARDVTYKLDENGQIIRRDETRESTPSQASPHEIFYRFAGKQMGMIGNNGTSDTGYSESVVERSAYDEPPTSSNAGLFRNGKKTGASFYADFAQSLTPANSNAQGSSGGSYTVRAGDTLATIAQMLYGDANLWYKIAEANGLSSGSALVEGMALTLPAGVTKNTHNAETFKPYDPMDAIGDLSPTTPKPPKKPKCAMLKMILVAVVAIGVAAWLGPQMIGAAQGLFAGGATAGGAVAGGAVAGGAVVGGAGIGAGIAGLGAGAGLVTAGISTATIAGAVVGGAITGVIASAVSQGVGIAIGAQNGFSWKGVGLSALGGGIGAGAGAANLFGSGTGAAIGRGIATSALTQGIGRVTGLQSKFDFAGVAAAGVNAGVSSFVDARTGSLGNFERDVVSSTAAGLASAATRSAITGNSFGDSLRAAIPDIIGQVLGNAGARGAAALARSVSASATARPSEGGGTSTGAHAEDAVAYGGAFDADGFNNELIQSSLLGFGSRAPASVTSHGIAPGGDDGQYDGEIIVVEAGRHMKALLSRQQMGDAGFLEYERLTGGTNSHYLAHKFQNRTSSASSRGHVTTTPRPSRGFWGTMADLFPLVSNTLEAGYLHQKIRFGGGDAQTLRDFHRASTATADGWTGVAQGLYSLATDFAMMRYNPVLASQTGVNDRMIARGGAMVDGLKRVPGNLLIGFGGLADVAITGRGSASEYAAYAVTGTIEAGSIAFPLTRTRSLAPVGAAEAIGPRIIEGIDASILDRSHSIGGARSIRNVNEISDIMRKDGYAFDPIDVIEHDGGMIIVDGHHRAAAAMRTNTPVNVRVVGPDSFPMGSGGWQSVDEVILGSQTVGPNRLNAPGRRR
ncbi:MULTISPECIES: LysM peptidoglycan-binding domain-containing protein [unclassified Sphingopyxis]|uniref:LysM peptidoglycan-binding domain-containing protein n=1 Tax=unclassified Sphingopyxis TaxID=2614943 RepID=UPI000B0E6597|nr:MULTISPECIES: LysM peptidoglycan-binding domain-containing protein [unclassified Sphingopyxis]